MLNTTEAANGFDNTQEKVRPRPTRPQEQLHRDVCQQGSITNVTSSRINNQAGFLSPSSPRSESGSPSSGRALADCGVSCHTTSGPADNSSTGERKDVNPKVGSTSQTVQSLSSRLC